MERPISKITFYKNKNRNKFRNRFLKFFLLPLVVIGFVISAYQLYKKQAVIIFYFQKNKYQKLAKEQKAIQEKLFTEDQIDKEKLDALREKYYDLISEYPDEPLLFYYLGALNFTLFERQIRKSDSFLPDTILSHFLDDRKIIDLSKQKEWRNAVVYFRKALALKLPPEQSSNIICKLAYLYLFRQKIYSGMVEDFLEQYPSELKENYYYEIAKVVASNQKPDWKYLGEVLPEPFFNYLKGLHAIRVGNKPRGFFLLNRVIATNNASPRTRIYIDNALYLMGHLNRNRGRPSTQQIYYHSRIKLDSFMQRNPWFFDEYLFSLRFFGRKQKIKEVQNIHSKLFPVHGQ